jgi:hypothetical protein
VYQHYCPDLPNFETSYLKLKVLRSRWGGMIPKLLEAGNGLVRGLGIKTGV